MRFLFLLLTVPLCVAVPAFAQVTVNLNALNALPTTGTPANRATPEARHYRVRPRSAQRRVARLLPTPPIPPGTAGTATVATAAPSAAPSVTPAGPSGVAPRPAPPPPPPAAVVPPAAPPQVALAPLPPPSPAAAPPPPPVVAQAPSHATANTTGLTVSFGPDSADLSPASAAAVASLAHSVPQSDSISFNVLAYAHGQADDPSSARRLSLSRALSIRSALTAAGVSSTRIYLRALGAEAGGGSPDRADITVMGANAPATTAAATPNAAPRGKQE